jgi:sulfur carrier protein
VIHVNGTDDDYLDESVAALLERRGIDARGVAVAVNGEVAPRSSWGATRVPDGALVEILTAAAGG